MTDNTPWRIIHGDALLELRNMHGADYAAIITDPPYASGGMSMAERSRSTRDKYTSYGEQGNPYPDFSGDALAQRAWTSFMHEIMVAARAACKPGAVCALFVDWRQLPALCEYIVWGSNGPLPTKRGVSVLPGLFQVPNVPTQDRWHQTQKPLALMQQVVRICESGGTIIDPFAGSGSTIVAALCEGYKAVGIEQEAHYIDIIRRRMQSVQLRMVLPDTTLQSRIEGI